MDQANLSSSIVPSSSATASPLVSDDPSYIDIEVDVEVPVVQSPELEQVPSLASVDSLDAEGPHSMSVDASSLVSFPVVEDFMQHAVNWPRVIKLLGIFTTITILIVLVVVGVVPRRTRTMHECKISFSVSKDGKSDFRTVSEAVEAAPTYSPSKVCILIRMGEYHEMVEIGPQKTNLVFIGEGIQKTIITSNASFDGASGDSPASTLWVTGKEFMARDLTIFNTAKYGVAVNNWADNSVFFRCKFEGKNMSLHVKGQKQFYRDCHVYGESYLVSGDASSFFQRCEFFSEKSYHEEKIVFSGNSRQLLSYKTGFVFHLCAFHTSSTNSSQKVFLGSALGDAALIVVMQCYLDASITGYFIDSSVMNNTYFAIFGNTGPGATTDSVPPFVHALGDTEAESEFSLRGFLDGGNWIPAEVEYDLDLAK